MASITQDGAPNKNTIGQVGDIYTDSLTNKQYICFAIYATVVNNTEVVEYDWDEIPKNISGGDGSAVSPTVTVSEIEGGHRVNITDVNGIKQFTVMDGATGSNGADGTSPTIAESPDNNDAVYKLDITDVNGTFTTPNLMGQGGEGSGETNVQSDWDETNQESDAFIQNKPTFEVLTVEDVNAMVGLSDEELEALANVIADGEVRTDKTYSSAKINELIAKAQLGGDGDVDLSGLATKAELEAKADSTHTHTLADVTDYEAPNLSEYAKTEDIPDVSNFVEKEDGKGLFSGSYNDLTDQPEIPSINGLVTEESLGTTLADYAKTIDIPEEYDDTELSNRITANEDAITTLNGSGEGSVTKTVNDALNEFATNISNDGIVNTYKELVDYAASHSSDVAEMVGDIETNTTAIDGLDGRVETLETNLGGHTVKSDVPANAKFTDTTNFLPLAGGAMDENAEISLSGTTGTTSIKGGVIKTNGSVQALDILTTNIYGESGEPGDVIDVYATLLMPDASVGGDLTVAGTITGDLTGKVNGYTIGASVPDDAKFTDTVYTLPTAGSTLGGVKTPSTVTSTSGLTASPIIDGVPYYDKRTAVSSPLPNSTTFGTYYPMLCNTVATNASSLSVDTGVKFGPRSGSLTLDGSNTTTADSSFVSLDIKMPKSGQYSSKGIKIAPAGSSSYHTGMSIDCGTSTGPGMMGLSITCTVDTHQPALQVSRTGGSENSYAISSTKGRSYIADIYSNAAINTTSDREKKTDIKEISGEYEDLFFKLQPRLFKYKDGNSGRVHIGAIAQDVEEALNAVGISDMDFAGFVRQEKDYKVDEETGEVTQEEGYDYYLRYEEFIMLLCHMLQKLYTEKEEQDNKIADMESRLASLESKLS